jgi:predicted transcriptional regulator
MQLGLKVSKWHRALKFEQKPWMASYIQKNTDLRAKSKNDFEKSFFKLMNNSVFGKTMEDVRNRAKIEIIRNEELYAKRASDPRFKSRTFVGEKLRIVESQNASVKLNKPIYVGGAVLDLSKLLMYDFYYNKVKKCMPDVRCGYTDTDSLMLVVPGERDRIYKEMGLDEFDNSDLPKDHPYYNTNNKKVVGKFKDEYAGKVIDQIIAIRPKVYSIKSGDDYARKIKGVRSNVKITHENYLRCCISNSQEDMRQTIKQHSLISKKHVIHLVEQKKTSLSNTDDKRYHLSPTESLAHGHYRANALINDQALQELLAAFGVL